MKKVKTKKTVKRSKKYPSHYLAVALLLSLVVEGIVFGSATPAGWRDAGKLLDMSGEVSQTVTDTAEFFQPIAYTVSAISQFYSLATDQMMILLDLSQSFSEAAIVYEGVGEFYQQASTQMAGLLDASHTSIWPGRLAGISITVQR